MDSNLPTTFDTLQDSHGNPYFVVDNAKIIWTNFSGTETPFNRKGKRNFVWVIPDGELAQQLAALGFNIKHRSVRDGYDGEEFDHLRIDISYETDDGRPIGEINKEWVPEVYLVNDDDYFIPINEDGIGEFDTKIITYALFEFRKYDWTYGGKSGTSAKLKRIFLKVKQDPIMARFKRSDAIHPNDYSVMRTEELRDRREANGQVPGGDDLPFAIP